jgi:hypothetical protein
VRRRPPPAARQGLDAVLSSCVPTSVPPASAATCRVRWLRRVRSLRPLPPRPGSAAMTSQVRSVTSAAAERSAMKRRLPSRATQTCAPPRRRKAAVAAASAIAAGRAWPPAKHASQHPRRRQRARGSTRGDLLPGRVHAGAAGGGRADGARGARNASAAKFVESRRRRSDVTHANTSNVVGGRGGRRYGRAWPASRGRRRRAVSTATLVPVATTGATPPRETFTRVTFGGTAQVPAGPHGLQAVLSQAMRQFKVFR